MGREEGGGFRMGSICIPVMDSFDIWQNQYNYVKFKNKITLKKKKTLESPLDCKEIQPVHPKGNPECSLEGLMLKLKLQYFGHLM